MLNITVNKFKKFISIVFKLVLKHFSSIFIKPLINGIKTM